MALINNWCQMRPVHTCARSSKPGLAAQVGLLVQNLVTFAVAYLVAFSSGWKMTLVVTASIPLMVIAGGIQASVMTGFNSQARAGTPHLLELA